jgi:hypothetical protein
MRTGRTSMAVYRGKFKIIRSSLAMAACLALLGCGYVFEGGGSVLPADISKIYIPLVQNNTTEAGLTTTVTEALRDRFERYGVVTVVDDISQADAVLKARILRVRRATGTVTSQTDTALQLDTTIVLAGELRRVTGPVLWSNPSISVSKPIATASSAVVTSSSAFANSPLSAENLNRLGSRDVSRAQDQQMFELLADQAALQIYSEAVTPDF